MRQNEPLSGLCQGFGRNYSTVSSTSWVGEEGGESQPGAPSGLNVDTFIVIEFCSYDPWRH